MMKLEDTEWIARTNDVRVRVNTLGPGQSTPWHLHSTTTDTVFCMEEGLHVRMRDPDEEVSLRPGERRHVAPGRVHQVVNATPHPLRYLLVQATGPYDFIEVE